MNVVIVAPRLPPHCDGVGDHANALANALARCGHNVTVLTAGSATLQPSYNTIVLGESWGFRTTFSALKYLRAHKPQRVLLEYTPFLFGGASPAPVLIAWECRRLRIPCSVIAHEIFYGSDSSSMSSPAKARYFAWRDALVLRGAARIAVPNADRRERIRARLPALEPRVEIVPIAANVEPGAQYARSAAQPDVFRIAAFGVVMPRRRYEIAIRALAEIRKSRDAQLTIVGRIFDGEYARKCLDLAAQLGIGDYVAFTGSLSPSQVSQRLADTDAAVHTTMEGSTRSSGSLLALLAHGIPTVAVRTAHDDACFDDVVLYAGEEQREVAQALLSLAFDRAKAAGLGERAAHKYRTFFDWRALAQSLAS